MHREATHHHRSLRSQWIQAMVCLLIMIPVGTAYAHGVSSADREAMVGGGALEYIWLGATHMLTGYDHLLFLVGVIFFLTSFRDVVRFITAFTVGHCITLMGATLAGISANAHLIDAVIAVSLGSQKTRDESIDVVVGAILLRRYRPGPALRRRDRAAAGRRFYWLPHPNRETRCYGF